MRQMSVPMANECQDMLNNINALRFMENCYVIMKKYILNYVINNCNNGVGMYLFEWQITII